jgi:aryl carrier-like protein
MIPHTFSLLEEMPRTRQGKIDRRALTALQPVYPEMGGELILPRNEVERELANIWAEMLGLKQVGVEDNFFELGGHSLLAMQLVSRLRALFRIDLALRTLFESPTIAAISQIIQREINNGGDLSRPSIKARQRDAHSMKRTPLTGIKP